MNRYLMWFKSLKSGNFFKRPSFSMAEILISLTVIGIVAAVTLPALKNNVSQRAWNAQKKALFVRLDGALSLMPALNGFGEYTVTVTETEEEGEEEGETIVTTTTDVTDTAALTFVTKGLSKKLEMNRICDVDEIEKCGIPPKITTLSGSAITFPKKVSELNPVAINPGTYSGANYAGAPDTKIAAFETKNGESVAVFYNPVCTPTPTIFPGTSFPFYYVQEVICVNLIYDLNGLALPNTVGKDVGFVTALYSSGSSVVSPTPLSSNAATSTVTVASASQKCAAQAKDTRVPTENELASMFYNYRLLNITVSQDFIGTGSYQQDFNIGIGMPNKTSNNYLRCVRRR